MFIELTELLVCPACRPGQGLVARVDRLEGRRVVEGSLGCPACEARYPIRGGVARFAREPWPGRSAAAGPPEVALEALTTLLAALLGLEEGGGGYVLVGHGLAAAAPGLRTIAAEREIVALGVPPEAGEETEVGRVSWLQGVDPGRLPFFPGRFRGVAFTGGTSVAVEEAIRLLGPRGRLVLLRPAEEDARTVSSGPLEVLASDPRAIVAIRP